MKVTIVLWIKKKKLKTKTCSRSILLHDVPLPSTQSSTNAVVWDSLVNFNIYLPLDQQKQRSPWLRQCFSSTLWTVSAKWRKCHFGAHTWIDIPGDFTLSLKKRCAKRLYRIKKGMLKYRMTSSFHFLPTMSKTIWSKQTKTHDLPPVTPFHGHLSHIHGLNFHFR